LDSKFNEDSKNVPIIDIFPLLVSFTSNFVPDCQTVLKSCKNQCSEKFSCSIQCKTCFWNLWQLF